MSERVKKLYRSTKDRKVAGICGGLGRYFQIDPTIFRALFVVFSVFGGSGILAYIILWLVVPQELETTEPADDLTD